MSPLLEPTPDYSFARQDLTPSAREALAIIEDAIADGPPDYGWENRTTFPNGVVAVHAGALTVSFLPRPDGTSLMLNVEDDNAPVPWG